MFQILLRLLFAAALLFVLGLGSVFLALVLYDPFDDRTFNAQIWTTAPAEVRAAMARDVIRNQIRAGMTSVEMAELLGEPETYDDAGHRIHLFRNSRAGVKTYVYGLGSWSLYNGMDDAFLYIHVDADDRVVSAEIAGG